jgi:hypothetical protein
VGQPNRLCLSVVVGTLVLAYLAFDHPFRTGAGGSGGVTDEFLGSWTDERGEPGNSVDFSLVEVPLPNDPIWVTAYEGRATFRKLFGADEVRTTWGYESLDPPRLNVTFDGRNRVAAIRFLDHDHLVMRFVERLPYWTGIDVFEGPEVVLLTRTHERQPPAQAPAAP